MSTPAQLLEEKLESRGVVAEAVEDVQEAMVEAMKSLTPHQQDVMVGMLINDLVKVQRAVSKAVGS